MTTYSTLLILVITTSIVSATTPDTNPRNEDLTIAIQQMQSATYFSFVMLLNMYTPDRIPKNVTFLMPSDRTLSEISLPVEETHGFLMQHSIPSPLLIDHLERFPTGSVVPTLKPNFMLRIVNNGRRNFYLNNVQIISPNVCTAGSSIRCHGIKGVLEPVLSPSNTSSSPSCSPPGTKAVPAPEAPVRPKNVTVPASPSWSPPLTPPKGPVDQITMSAPPPTNLKIGSKKSDSSHLIARGLFQSIIPCIILAFITFQI